MTDSRLPEARTFSRRSVLRTAAWSAPVLAVAIAAPAAAASTGTIPVAKLIVSNYGAQNRNAGGLNRGPLGWNGGQIQYMGTGSDPAGTVDYSVVITGPGGLSVVQSSGTVPLVNYGSYNLPGFEYGTAPMAAGLYTVTVTVWGSDGSIVDPESVTFP